MYSFISSYNILRVLYVSFFGSVVGDARLSQNGAFNARKVCGFCPTPLFLADFPARFSFAFFFSPRSPFYFAILLCVFAVDLGAILFLFSLFILFARSRTSDILESRMRN